MKDAIKINAFQTIMNETFLCCHSEKKRIDPSSIPNCMRKMRVKETYIL